MFKRLLVGKGSPQQVAYTIFESCAKQQEPDAVVDKLINDFFQSKAYRHAGIPLAGNVSVCSPCARAAATLAS